MPAEWAREPHRVRYPSARNCRARLREVCRAGKENAESQRRQHRGKERVVGVLVAPGDVHPDDEV
jgi:hypothetical protein